MHLTHRWLDRCMKRFHETEPLYGHHQELFPIVQGSVYPDLRKESAEYVIKHEAGGYAIGGLSVGEPHEDMYAMTEEVNHILPLGKPRYLMGVGTPENILESIERGVDMFDCVMPTRNARNGMLFTSNGIVNIRNKKWERVFESIDSIITPDYSFAYMRHLFAAGEMLGPIIASIQNLSFYLWMVREARKHIVEGDFTEWKSRVLPVFSQRL
jgi:queuine tRNA-ribosyltransferase